MKKVVLVILLLGLGVAAGVLGHRALLARGEAAATGALRLHGNIEMRDAQLAFFGQERIAKVLVEEGDPVEAGQLLATLATERLEAEIASVQARIAAQVAVIERLENGSRPQEIEAARAELAATQARIQFLELQISRYRKTTESGATSRQLLDDAVAQIDVEKAQLRVREQSLDLVIEGPRQEDITQARASRAALDAELALLERRLVDSELHAPSAGVIRSRILEPGEMAAPERPVFTLALTQQKWVRAWIPEPELGRVEPGAKAELHTDSFGGRSYEGTVGFISPVAEFTPKSVETAELRTKLVYEARILVEDPRSELRLGMPVTVDILGSGADETDDER